MEVKLLQHIGRPEDRAYKQAHGDLVQINVYKTLVRPEVEYSIAYLLHDSCSGSIQERKRDDTEGAVPSY